MPFIFERVATFLFWMVAVLLVTGGVHFNSQSAKIEISQIDPFSIPLMVLLLWQWKSQKKIPQSISKKWNRFTELLSQNSRATLFGAFTLYVLVYSILQTVRYDSFNASAFDLSYVGQAIWSTLHGAGFLHSDICRGGTYLGEHFSPILSVLSPFMKIWDSIYFLFILQSILLGSASLFVYKLARIKKIPEKTSLILALCALLYHPLRAANSFYLREDNFFIPVFFSLLLFLELKNWTLFWISALFSFLIKENAPLFTLMIGFWIALTRKNRIQGFILIFISVFAFWLINTKLTPIFSGPQNRTMLVQRLPQFGSTNQEILLTLLSKPHLVLAEFVKIFLAKDSLYYLLAVLAPFICFIRKPIFPFLIACARITLNLIMNANKIGYHYECILIPFLFYSLIQSVSTKELGAQQSFLLLLSFLLFFGRSPIDDIRRQWPTDRDRWVAGELRRIPAEATVSAQFVIHPHLIQRKSISIISEDFSTDYIVADLAPHRSRFGNENLESMLSKIDPSKYEKLVEQDSFTLWKRK